MLQNIWHFSYILRHFQSFLYHFTTILDIFWSIYIFFRNMLQINAEVIANTHWISCKINSQNHRHFPAFYLYPLYPIKNCLKIFKKMYHNTFFTEKYFWEHYAQSHFFAFFLLFFPKVEKGNEIWTFLKMSKIKCRKNSWKLVFCTFSKKKQWGFWDNKVRQKVSI